MAAYASLVILAKNIDPIHGDLNHIYLDMDLKPLYEKVVQLQTIMENCPGETLSQEFQARIRDFGYRANRVIDTHYLGVLRWKKGERCVSLPKFHELTDEAAFLILEAQNLVGAVAATNMKELSLAPSSSSAHPPIAATQKVRLYSDITNLEERFYEGCSQRQVIPIVGMGGSGKTTLANFLFNDSRTVRRFDRKAWITVSQSYERCALLSQILRQFNAPAPENPTDAHYRDLGAKVFNTLRNRRYLVVIDDVWSEKLWNDIGIYLPDSGNGSRILLTTRLEDVANCVAPSTDDSNEKGYIHKAGIMNFDMSWSLLKDTVFGRDGDCPNELEEIGKSIAQQCRGLPLAIVAIAGVLSSTNNRKDLWEEISADVKIAIKKSSSGVAKILSWSYINLPHHLKPCFLYLASFREDYEITVTELMKLWVAEGFLKLNDFERYDEEEVAYHYLEDLAKKNLILVSKTYFNGKIRSIRLHDMIRDLCVEIAEKENFMSQLKGDCESSSEEIKDQIRFSICSKESFSGVEQIHDDSHIRTIINIADGSAPSTKLFTTSFGLLRVLDAGKVQFLDFPSQVMQLFLLRYLAFCMTSVNVVEVPSSVKELQSLQVLIVGGVTLKLPVEILKMSKLRHLISECGMMLPDPHSGMRSLLLSSSLENLQSLIGVQNFTQHVVQMIPNIKRLEISQHHSDGECSLWNLVYCRNLEILSVKQGDFSQKNIQLPRSLKELELVDCIFPWSDLGTVAGLLPNLEVMRLNGYGGHDLVWEVKEGEFPKLKLLEIRKCRLVTWKHDGEFGQIFPNLEGLKFFFLEDLIEFPWCIGEIETLWLIEVIQCNDLLMRWAREVKEEQESYGNDFLQVIITYEGEND